MGIKWRTVLVLTLIIWLITRISLKNVYTSPTDTITSIGYFIGSIVGSFFVAFVIEFIFELIKKRS